VGCTPVSPGCLNCYAATMARRLEAMGQTPYVGLTYRVGPPNSSNPDLADPPPGKRMLPSRTMFNGTVRCLPDRLEEPLHWKKPRRVFVNSMSDLFHEAVPFEFIDKVFAVMALCPQHTFQVLTKRPERMAEYLTDTRHRSPDARWWISIVDMNGMLCDLRAKVDTRNVTTAGTMCPLPNVWPGTTAADQARADERVPQLLRSPAALRVLSVEDQARADERIPQLLRCPAAVRFLSVEPLLGPVDLLEAWWHVERDGGDRRDRGIDWVIVGGESGPHARPCDVGWVRSIVGQCRDAGVPCCVKQLGANVVCRNDEVSDWMDQPGGPCLDDIRTDGVVMQGDPVRVLLRDRKGGDPSEWSDDLRVREWPATK